MEKDLFRLEHIEECANKIEQLVKQLKTLEKFKKCWIEQDAMIRNLEIIGEASNHISNHIKEQFNKVEWVKIKGMRNLIAHEYFGVTLPIIWNTAINDVPKLKTQIQAIIKSLKA